MLEKTPIDREVFESAYNTIKTSGSSSILKSPNLIEKRDVLKNKLINYYEYTEEYEKCEFLHEFFNRLEKTIRLRSIISSIKN